ncbi:hypothetical protein ABIA38_008885 [Embleya sp. AB8]
MTSTPPTVISRSSCARKASSLESTNPGAWKPPLDRAGARWPICRQSSQSTPRTRRSPKTRPETTPRTWSPIRRPPLHIPVRGPPTRIPHARGFPAASPRRHPADRRRHPHRRPSRRGTAEPAAQSADFGARRPRPAHYRPQRRHRAAEPHLPRPGTEPRAHRLGFRRDEPRPRRTLALHHPGRRPCPSPEHRRRHPRVAGLHRQPNRHTGPRSRLPGNPRRRAPRCPSRTRRPPGRSHRRHGHPYRRLQQPPRPHGPHPHRDLRHREPGPGTEPQTQRPTRHVAARAATGHPRHHDPQPRHGHPADDRLDTNPHHAADRGHATHRN